MREHEADVDWAATDMAPGTRQMADPGDSPVQTSVLARVPNLDEADPSPGPRGEAKRSRPDGRVISQRLSTKILMGGGALLLAAAVVPFVWSKMTNRNRADDGLPAWHQGRPAPDADEAPRWDSGATDAPAIQPADSNMIYQPDIPEVPGLSRLGNGSGGAIPAQPPAWGGIAPAKTLVTPPPTPGWQPQVGPPAWKEPAEVPLVADRRATWAQQGRAPATGRQPPISTWLGPSPQAEGARASLDPAGLDNSPMPNVQGPPSWSASRPLPTRSVQPVEPGMARFEGTIAIPSYRTTHDRPRSSIH
jgi:hypothetical protein